MQYSLKYPITHPLFQTQIINPLPPINVNVPEFLSQLPKDVLYTVTHFLTYPEILNLCRINKYFRDICQNPDFWRYLLRAKYPEFIRINRRYNDVLIQLKDVKEIFAFLDKYQIVFTPNSDINGIKYAYNTYDINSLIPLFDVFDLVKNSNYKDKAIRKFGTGYPNAGITRGDKYTHINISNYQEIRKELDLKSYLLQVEPDEFVDVLNYVTNGYYITRILPDIDCLYITRSPNPQKRFLDMIRYIPEYISENGFGYVIYESVIFPTPNGDVPAMLSKQYFVNPIKNIIKMALNIFDYNFIDIYSTNNPTDIYWNYGIAPDTDDI